jgi:hypothetical protein
MLGDKADFRPSQWEAIETVAILKKRALVVQRTGWGKSQVLNPVKSHSESGSCRTVRGEKSAVDVIVP